MGKILSKYQDNLDKAWFDSSNVLYAECDDNDNSLKTVRITFKDGSTYEYKDVNVTDWLLFREDASNGKAFFKYIKKYDFEKKDKLNTEDIKKELEYLLEEVRKVEEENGDRGNTCTE